jgi:hypothetical protein
MLPLFPSGINTYRTISSLRPDHSVGLKCAGTEPPRRTTACCLSFPTLIRWRGFFGETLDPLNRCSEIWAVN